MTDPLAHDILSSFGKKRGKASFGTLSQSEIPQDIVPEYLECFEQPVVPVINQRENNRG
jgi:hypothetical protein